MKPCVCHIVLCVTLVFLASPNVFADTYTVPNGGGTGFGNWGGSGWGSNASAWASANGGTPASYGVTWGSLTLYATEAGWYWVGYTCCADAYGNVTDNDGSGATAGGGGMASVPCGDAWIAATADSGGQIGGYDDGPYSDPGCWDYVYVWLGASDSISVSCEAQAAAVVEQGHPNFGTGDAGANADIY